MPVIFAACWFVIPVNGQSAGKNTETHQTSAGNAQHQQSQSALPNTINIDTVNVEKLNPPKEANPSGQSNENGNKPQCYLSRLIAPETLPNVVLSIIGIAGVFVAISTLRIIRKQTSATEKAADAAKMSAQAVIDSERAWVVSSPAVLRPPLGFIPEPNDALNIPGRDTPNTFYVFLRNAGGTPAKILKTCAVYETIKSLESLAAEPSYPDVPTQAGVFLFNRKNADGDDETIGQLAYLGPNPILTKEQVLAVKTGKLFLYAYGYALYENAFKRSHTMRFGYIGSPKPINCPSRVFGRKTPPNTTRLTKI
jgi:hypothetical protein